MDMAALLAEKPCLLDVMYTCLHEMMAMVKTAIQAGITPVRGIPGTMLPHQETMHTGITGILVVMTMAQEVTVTVNMHVTGTTIRAPTGILMMATVTHVVLRLQEGHRHHTVEAADMMITAAHGMAMAVETVTRAEMISTQVVGNVLADKTAASLLLWTGDIRHHEIHTAAQAVEHQEVVGVEEAGLTEVVAGADTKATTLGTLL